MYDLVLFVLGVALAEVATTTRLRDWSWHAVIVTLTLTIVAVAGARRASQRRRDRELYEAERRGEEKGRKAFKGAGKDELRWFDHALEVFYNRYCTDELLLANWIRLTVERSLQNRELLGGVISGVTIPRFNMGESRLVCHRTTPFRVDRPEELYLDLQLKWFSECRAKVAFELHALTGGGVFTCYITNASFEAVWKSTSELGHRHAIAHRHSNGNTSMAWGARNSISTQVRRHVKDRHDLCGSAALGRPAPPVICRNSESRLRH
jgi:hypothetical protein